MNRTKLILISVALVVLALVGVLTWWMFNKDDSVQYEEEVTEAIQEIDQEMQELDNLSFSEEPLNELSFNEEPEVNDAIDEIDSTMEELDAESDFDDFSDINF